MVDITEVGENIFLIDSQLYSIPQWGSVYLVNETRKALIDTGPATSANAVLEGIRRIGVRPQDIDYIIVTHIHLDHAGGAGVLIREMPRAQVMVHHRGARHLVNPARLISSVIEAQGEAVMAREGEVLPIDADKVKSVYDGDEIRLSEKQVLKIIETPGHAPHELCVKESRSNGIFTGDAVGIYVAGVLLPATAPPNFDLELWVNSINKLIELEADRLYFGHFGVADKAQMILQMAMEKLRSWGETVSAAEKKGGIDLAADRLIAQIRAELGPIRETKSRYEYVANNEMPLSVRGYIKYYQEKHEVEPEKGRKCEGNR